MVWWALALTRSLEKHPQYKCRPRLVTLVPTFFRPLCGVLFLRSRRTVIANPATRKLDLSWYLVLGTRNNAENVHDEM